MKLLRRILAVLGLVTATTALQVINPAIVEAAPSGDFSIVTKNGNRLDVYGDNLPTSKAPVHLWKASYRSNIFTLGPNESTGNEIRLKADQSICLTPDVPLGTKPASGTPLVAKKDCANSYNFKFDGNKIYLGRYPDMCIDIPNNNDVERQRLQVHACNNDSTAQSFNTGNNPIPQPVQKQAVQQKQIVKEYSEYEYWIVSRARKNQFLPVKPEVGRPNPEVGHAWNAIIKRKTYIYSDGSKSVTNWQADTIFEYNPPASVNNYTSLNVLSSGESFNETQAILDGKTSIFTRGYAVRKASVSEGRAQFIKNNSNVAGCKKYISNFWNLYSVQVGGDTCNCVDYSTRSWKYYTAGWEDFRPKTGEAAAFFGFGLYTVPVLTVTQIDNPMFNLTPDALMESLKAMSSKNGTDFLDNGKTW
jgi:hypothetical protein